MEQKTRDEGSCNATSCLILTLAFQSSPLHFPTMLQNCSFYTRTGFCNFNSSIASLDGCASAYACGKNHIFRDVPSVLIFVLFIHAVLYLSFPLNEFSVLLLSMFACHVFFEKNPLYIVKRGRDGGKSLHIFYLAVKPFLTMILWLFFQVVVNPQPDEQTVTTAVNDVIESTVKLLSSLQLCPTGIFPLSNRGHDMVFNVVLKVRSSPFLTYWR